MDKAKKREYDRKRYLLNKEEILEMHKRWRKKFLKEWRKKYYEKNKEKLRAMGRKDYLRHREKRVNNSKEYRKNHKEQWKEYQKRYGEKNSLKINERVFINYYKEKLKKSHCKKCGSTKNLEFHHLDYNHNSFNVITLCLDCHKKLHRKGGE